MDVGTVVIHTPTKNEGVIQKMPRSQGRKTRRALVDFGEHSGGTRWVEISELVEKPQEAQ